MSFNGDGFVDLRLRFRFTTTRVGIVQGSCGQNSLPKVHPHACGYNNPAGNVYHGCDGSPTRVWGQCPRSFIRYRGRQVHPHSGTHPLRIKAFPE